ncbi:hypothetical protein B7486_04915 [cyanobacterium TDX16]|nr:hypothetical protein B7486_04915 [cyanobacterium TDX16]
MSLGQPGNGPPGESRTRLVINGMGGRRVRAPGIGNTVLTEYYNRNPRRWIVPDLPARAGVVRRDARAALTIDRICRAIPSVFLFRLADAPGFV